MGSGVWRREYGMVQLHRGSPELNTEVQKGPLSLVVVVYHAATSSSCPASALVYPQSRCSWSVVCSNTFGMLSTCVPALQNLGRKHKEQKHLKVWNENSPRLVWMNVVDLMWINHPCLCFSLFIHFFDLVIFNLIVITESSGENSALVWWCAVSSCGF